MQCRSRRIKDRTQFPGGITGTVTNTEIRVDVRNDGTEGSLDGLLEVRLVIVEFEFLSTKKKGSL